MLYSGYWCDKCGKGIRYERNVSEWLPSKMYLIEFARDAGWSIGKQTLCPDCRKRVGRRGKKSTVIR